MIVGGLVAAFLGVDAENKSLEDVATPLSMRRPGTRAEGAARTALVPRPPRSRGPPARKVGRGSVVPAPLRTGAGRRGTLASPFRALLSSRTSVPTARSVDGLPAADVVGRRPRGAGRTPRCAPDRRRHRRHGRPQLRPSPAGGPARPVPRARAAGVDGRGRLDPARRGRALRADHRGPRRRSCPGWPWRRAPSVPRRSASAARWAGTSARRPRPGTPTRRCSPPTPSSRSSRPPAAPGASRPTSSSPA